MPGALGQQDVRDAVLDHVHSSADGPAWHSQHLRLLTPSILSLFPGPGRVASCAVTAASPDRPRRHLRRQCSALPGAILFGANDASPRLSPCTDIRSINVENSCMDLNGPSSRSSSTAKRAPPSASRRRVPKAVACIPGQIQ
eukprot:4963783-Pyramimonas_sp.AAC.1